MIRKRVTLFGSALREITPIASTTSATFTTLVPLKIRGGGRNQSEVEATGIRLLLGVTTRTTNDAAPLSLNVFLEEQDPTGVWRGIAGSTLTPVVTSNAYETLEIYPGIDFTTAPLRRSFLLPGRCRAVAKLQGSVTVTPGTTFFLEAELFS
jgi:hypothetical protein